MQPITRTTFSEFAINHGWSRCLSVMSIGTCLGNVSGFGFFFSNRPFRCLCEIQRFWLRSKTGLIVLTWRIRCEFGSVRTRNWWSKSGCLMLALRWSLSWYSNWKTCSYFAAYFDNRSLNPWTENFQIRRKNPNWSGSRRENQQDL